MTAYALFLMEQTGPVAADAQPTPMPTLIECRFSETQNGDQILPLKRALAVYLPGGTIASTKANVEVFDPNNFLHGAKLDKVSWEVPGLKITAPTAATRPFLLVGTSRPQAWPYISGIDSVDADGHQHPIVGRCLISRGADASDRLSQLRNKALERIPQ
jgi:hypothetical protein